MEFITYIFDSIKFFVYIILCASLYIVFDGYMYKKTEKSKEKIKKHFKEEILYQLNSIKNHKNLREYELDNIKNKIKKRKYEEVFNETISEFNVIDDNYKVTKIYMEGYEDYIKRLIKRFKNSDDIKKVYIVSLLGEYGLNKDYINNFLKKSINTKSSYLRFAILTSISKIGNKKVFIEILESISKTKFNINEKILIDIMDNFKSDMNLLDKEILINFDKFDSKIKSIVVKHFSNTKFKEASLKLLNILKDEDENRELRLSILDYFKNVKFEKAKDTLLLNLKSKEWEFRALTAKTLKNYNEEKVIKALLESIKDLNWYVKFNSANSLLSFNLEEEILQDIYNNEDERAREILSYAMKLKEGESRRFYNEAALTITN